MFFESGALQPNGAISGNDNDERGVTYEPHYDVIQSSDQVQIYEAIMAIRYQPIAYRWAQNLKGYAAAEPQRFVRYYESMTAGSSAVLGETTVRVAIPGEHP